MMSVKKKAGCALRRKEEWVSIAARRMGVYCDEKKDGCAFSYTFFRSLLCASFRIPSCIAITRRMGVHCDLTKRMGVHCDEKKDGCAHPSFFSYDTGSDN